MIQYHKIDDVKFVLSNIMGPEEDNVGLSNGSDTWAIDRLT